ncbi:unnamed protein product [Heligmosomoides polygyrus]|uniref:Kinesin motor domain-containing protein n=1 Tax=Heligmosomoides polygyrus TaxID=6339 RepID=A0A183G067_HELPZ|nr:unnamed protein product [Heligmosomoides polygyrus]
MSGKEQTNPSVDVQLGAVSLEDSEDDELQVSAKAVQLVKDIQEMVRQRKQEQDELIQLRQLLALRDQELSVLRRAQESRSRPAQPMEVEETSKPGWWEKACGLEGVNCEDFPLIAGGRKVRKCSTVRERRALDDGYDIDHLERPLDHSQKVYDASRNRMQFIAAVEVPGVESGSKNGKVNAFKYVAQNAADTIIFGD